MCVCVCTYVRMCVCLFVCVCVCVCIQLASDHAQLADCTCTRPFKSHGGLFFAFAPPPPPPPPPTFPELELPAEAFLVGLAGCLAVAVFATLFPANLNAQLDTHVCMYVRKTDKVTQVQYSNSMFIHTYIRTYTLTWMKQPPSWSEASGPASAWRCLSCQQQGLSSLYM